MIPALAGQNSRHPIECLLFYVLSCDLNRSESSYHVTTSLNVISHQNDILAEPPYGPLYGVTSGSKLGLVKASGYEKSLVTTAFL